MAAWTYRCQSAGKAAQKIVPLRPRTPCWKGLSADSEEKREPVSDVNTAMMDSLKTLDPKRPIREAAIEGRTKLRRNGNAYLLLRSNMDRQRLAIIDNYR